MTPGISQNAGYGGNDLLQIGRYFERQARLGGYLDHVWSLCAAELTYEAAIHGAHSMLGAAELVSLAAPPPNRESRRPILAGQVLGQHQQENEDLHDGACLSLLDAGLLDVRDLGYIPPPFSSSPACA